MLSLGGQDTHTILPTSTRPPTLHQQSASVVFCIRVCDRTADSSAFGGFSLCQGRLCLQHDSYAAFILFGFYVACFIPPYSQENSIFAFRGALMLLLSWNAQCLSTKCLSLFSLAEKKKNVKNLNRWIAVIGEKFFAMKQQLLCDMLFLWVFLFHFSP